MNFVLWIFLLFVFDAPVVRENHATPKSTVTRSDSDNNRAGRICPRGPRKNFRNQPSIECID